MEEPVNRELNVTRNWNFIQVVDLAWFSPQMNFKLICIFYDFKAPLLENRWFSDFKTCINGFGQGGKAHGASRRKSFFVHRFYLFPTRRIQIRCQKNSSASRSLGFSSVNNATLHYRTEYRNTSLYAEVRVVFDRLDVWDRSIWGIIAENQSNC